MPPYDPAATSAIEPSPHRSTFVYKIVTRGDWQIAERDGAFDGSRDDHRDGFIHLSTADQVVATLHRHFAGQGDLKLIAVRADELGEALKFEVSRGGDAFPHLYGPLRLTSVAWQRDLDLDAAGNHLIDAAWLEC